MGGSIMNSREYQVECQYCEEGSVYTPAPRFTKALEWEYDEKESDCGECDGTGLVWEECIGHMLPYVTKYKTYTECDCVECEEKKGNTK
jgi:hypothetical protein